MYKIFSSAKLIQLFLLQLLLLQLLLFQFFLFQFLRSCDHIALILSWFFYFSFKFFTHTITSFLFCHDFSSLSFIRSHRFYFVMIFHFHQLFFRNHHCSIKHLNHSLFQYRALRIEILIFNTKFWSSTRNSALQHEFWSTTLSQRKKVMFIVCYTSHINIDSQLVKQMFEIEIHRQILF